jgi:hypothetical protein
MRTARKVAASVATVAVAAGVVALPTFGAFTMQTTHFTGSVTGPVDGRPDRGGSPP